MKLDVFGDKEVTTTTLETYKEMMEIAINKAGKDINASIKQHWDAIEKNITNGQHKRNRKIVKEIIETTQDFRNSLKDQFERMREEYENE